MFDRQVRKNVTQAPAKAPAGTRPNTILHAMPIKMTAIQYVDSEENIRATVVVTAGNEHYVPDNGELWVKNLAPLKEDLKRAFNAMHDAKNAVPRKDDVEVV